MNETGDETEGADSPGNGSELFSTSHASAGCTSSAEVGRKELILDVTRLPLLGLVESEDSVLDACIRGVVEDVVTQRELTAGFGNIP